MGAEKQRQVYRIVLEDLNKASVAEVDRALEEQKNSGVTRKKAEQSAMVVGQEFIAKELGERVQLAEETIESDGFNVEINTLGAAGSLIITATPEEFDCLCKIEQFKSPNLLSTSAVAEKQPAPKGRPAAAQRSTP